MSYKATRNWENANKMIFEGYGEYEIPGIAPVYEVPDSWISFNYARTAKDHSVGVHHFVDDYQFLREWTQPDAYIELFKKFACVTSPDFSTYAGFPVALQIYNHYRKHWIGAYLQYHGVNVIPTISWSTPDSYAWCFDGEPVGSVVAVSSVGVMQNKEYRRRFMQGYNEMLARLQPSKILFYGSVPDDANGNIIRVKPFTETMKERLSDGR